MSDKQDSKKKDGERTDKKRQAMHEAVNERQEQAERTAEGDPQQRNPNETNRSGTKS
ncbi:MAG TPA: hypothetical protein VM490_02805 [Armatimonadaceae bacterium]|jgi:hypothetical protein|nr:hypothetical protein [Armatimonadaceae bacterium]